MTTPNNAKLIELAEQCEQVADPDETLDRLIFKAIGGSGCPMDPWGGFRSYTFSLEAAMTLVPEGFDWIIGHTNGGLTIYAEVGGTGDEFVRFGNTPALALCAAALRARTLP